MPEPKWKKELRIQNLKDRVQLIKQLLDLVGDESDLVVAEIGVFKGNFIRELLRVMPKIKKVYGIDPYTISIDRLTWDQRDWDMYYDQTRMKFEKFPQVEIIRKTSDEAIKDIREKLHFIDIDGNHHYEQVIRDLENYEPLMIKGGLFSGHDYRRRDPGVVKAVDEYARKYGRNLQTTGGGICTWWWYVPSI